MTLFIDGPRTAILDGPRRPLPPSPSAEADELCERIAIVDHGRILAIGTPAELRRRVQRESIFRLELDRLEDGSRSLARLPGVVSASTAAAGESNGHERQTVVVNLVLENDAALGGVVSALSGVGASIRALRKSEPSLEDVFVELVGRGFDDADQAVGTDESPNGDSARRSDTPQADQRSAERPAARPHGEHAEEEELV